MYETADQLIISAIVHHGLNKSFDKVDVNCLLTIANYLRSNARFLYAWIHSRTFGYPQQEIRIGWLRILVINTSNVDGNVLIWFA